LGDESPVAHFGVHRVDGCDGRLVYHLRLAAIDATIVGSFTPSLGGFVLIRAKVPSVGRIAQTCHKRIYSPVVTDFILVIAILYANRLACGLC